MNLKKDKRKKAPLPFRLNILFFIVFLAFLVLVIQLGVVQILNGEAYQAEINKTTNDYTEVSVPRGQMYDRNHNLVVGNDAEYSITYTPEKRVQAEERLNIAERLSKYISLDSDSDLENLSKRDKREYWYLKNQKEAKNLLSQKEAEEIDDNKIYKETLKRIDEDKIDDYSDKQLEVIAIKKQMDQAKALTPHVIKNEDVTPKEFARVSAHLDELPGVNATTDWERKYPYDETFRNLAGSITSATQGIPKSEEDYYLTRGYSRNDRVGKSGLEEEYESALRGQKEKIHYITDKSGTVVDSDVAIEGKSGKDLVLTVDMELQEEIDELIRDEMKSAISSQPSVNSELEDAMAVVMDPKTGEILASSGQHYDRENNEFTDVGTAPMYKAQEFGSAVKGATVLAGYESGAIEPGQTFYDEPLHIKGTPGTKSSVSNLGLVNDLQALGQSSNVYMFYTAMRIGGDYNWQQNDGLDITFDAFDELRNYYAQFGLGIPTGVDVPYESTGYEGSDPDGGNLLDFAIGQYDTYTTIQMAQYVSTIANGGYRMKPHFVKNIRNPLEHDNGLGPVYKSLDTNVMNRIDMSTNEIERVQQGFYRAYNAPKGTASGYFANTSYDAAGKTGTAENKIYEDGEVKETENTALVGYAPYDDPEVAFALIVPDVGKKNESNINKKIGKGILDAYFDE